MDRGTRTEGAVKPCAEAAPVEIFGAVRHGWRPLADNCPQLVQIEIDETPCIVARVLDVLGAVARYALRASRRSDRESAID
jgi:hypothetical protein